MLLSDIQIKWIRSGDDFPICIEDIDDVSGLRRNYWKFKIAVVVGLRCLNQLNGWVHKLDGRYTDRVEAVSVLHLPIHARLPECANACEPKHPCAEQKPYEISHVFHP